MKVHGVHPIVLALAFFLELAGLVAIALWGWQASEGWTRFLLAIGVPLAAAAVWGIFRVPNDPGRATVAIPGLLRLALELAYYTFAVWALFAAGRAAPGWIMALLVAVNYLAGHRRVRWLIRQ